MKTKSDYTTTLRAVIRWSTGTIVAAATTAGACFLFPLASSWPALCLTVCLSLFVGLNIALPPLDPEDDWVPVRSSTREPSAKQAPVAQTKAEPAGEPYKAAAAGGVNALPVHIRRSGGAPAGTWHHLIQPGLPHAHEAHSLTVNQRRSTHHQVESSPAGNKSR